MQKIGNPAVVGLAGFGLTTMVLQFHNVGWMEGNSPVIWLGLIFGGLAQFIAGLQEQKTGNNFGYSAFTSYGAFWMALALLLIGKNFGFAFTGTDLGWFLVAWTLYTAIMWVGSMRTNTALALTFTTLLIGFILLDIAHFVPKETAPMVTKLAGYELMVCALLAWYCMAHAIYLEMFGRDILPVGKPWIKDSAPATVAAGKIKSASAS